ncbi:MAG: cytochrome-c peroxidase [Nitrospirae bacterium]|nr:cytochrome-c peroxidase [Nitrospirota bacterium]
MRRSQLLGVGLLCGIGIAGAVAVSPLNGMSGEPPPAGPREAAPVPLGLEDPSSYIPADNPQTAKKIELGRRLFFDKRLSKNNTIACASCHLPGLAFTDGKPVSTGINTLKGGRSAPAAINRVYSKAQFWDGRADTLEDQSIGPFVNPVEHGFIDHNEMVAKMKTIAGYGKARCTRCHSGFNFTDEKFHNLGIGWDTNTVDLGRYMVTKNPEDIGAFKTSTLREIARTAPYMHDGRFKTLDEVVNFYNQGGIANPHRDNTLIPLEMSEQEQADLVAFLKALNGEGWQQITAPTSFPK